MSFLNDIINFKPFNKQEEVDKEIAIECIKKHTNILSRENKIVHMTSSSWIVNKERTKVLLAYHKIYDSWAWTGGHCDGDSNLLRVALREAKEETSIVNVRPIVDTIFSLENLCVSGHMKNGEYVSSHMHINVTFLLEADENDKLHIKIDENKGVKWFLLGDALTVPTEKWMVDNIYSKLNKKLELFLKNVLEV
ncbi:MAG TPA: NUDIX hydrolase [Acholeplasmataceae bacterium]|jgi:8-oxo-dGTP pyrophosphatase MutT (NUDIX family)|nr:NUDIX hydrolase [Acholeplasmataceae bacterium]